MNPLSIFPQILFLGPAVVPVLLRIAIGVFIIYLAKERRNKEYSFSYYVYALISVLLFLGLYTQPTAILGIILIKFDFYLDYWKNRKTASISTEKYLLYFLAVMMLLSLLFMGPGAFSMDLPL